MHRGVVVELGVEGGDELVALLRRHDVTIDLGQYAGIAAHRLDVGCADERHWDAADALHLVFGGEAAQLAAVGVAADRARPQRLWPGG